MFRFLLEKHKKWRLNKRNAQTLEDIKKAKWYYTEGHELFMCTCFQRVNFYKYNSYESIHKLIPEFNRENLGSYIEEKHSIWWNVSDRESRIKAFDKLIEIYT